MSMSRDVIAVDEAYNRFIPLLLAVVTALSCGCLLALTCLAPTVPLG